MQFFRSRLAIPVFSAIDTALSSNIPARPANSGLFRVLYLCGLVVVQAAIASVVAQLLVWCIYLVTNLAFYGQLSVAQNTPAASQQGPWIIVVPVTGALITGWLWYAARRSRGVTRALLQPLPAVMAIGTGSPMGAEGPIMRAGAAWGAFISQRLKLTVDECGILLAAGAAAGMSYFFGSPLAAAVLAAELLLSKVTLRSMLPVILASITAAFIHYLYRGSAPLFDLPHVTMPAPLALLAYTGIGIIIGFLAAWITKAVSYMKAAFAKLPVPPMWWPAIGGLVVGVIGYFAPDTLGTGYTGIHNLLMGKVTLQMLLVLGVLKFISWCFAAGSGTPGGSIAPLFAVGGAWGLFIAFVLQAAFPQLAIRVSVAALIGMAAMFAGTTRALFTAIIFSLEITHEWNALLPLTCACAAAYFISFLLMRTAVAPN